MARLTDEELSRVLTAHALGELKTGNGEWDFPADQGRGYPCCLVQAARASSSAFFENDYSMDGVVSWFDGEYEESWTVEELLARLEAEGLA